MRNHNYKMAKGYKAPFLNQIVSWQVPETLEEAVGEGKMFDTVETLIRRAVGAVNIDRGHKIREAVDERPKTVEKDGKKVTEGRDGSKLTLADLATIAQTVNAKATDRVRGEGSAKKRAEKFDTIRSKAAEKAKNYTPEQLRVLADLGLAPDGATAEAPSNKKGK